MNIKGEKTVGRIVGMKTLQAVLYIYIYIFRNTYSLFYNIIMNGNSFHYLCLFLNTHILPNS